MNSLILSNLSVVTALTISFIVCIQIQIISINASRKHRSALDIGFVSLPTTTIHHQISPSAHHVTTLLPTLILKSTTNTTSIIDHQHKIIQQNDDHILYATKHSIHAHSLAVVPKKTIEKKIAIITETTHPIHTLIPIVRDTHLHHLPAIIHHHHNELISVLPTGGYGIGISKGGQGAGHGWWVPTF